MAQQLPEGVQILGEMHPGFDTILTPEALSFVARLHRTYNGRREALLSRRAERQKAIDGGELPGFLPETQSVREGSWKVANAPADLNDRRVEITGPVDRKMIINALNSGARVFMADLEDANSPTWQNQIEGQINLRDAQRRTLSFHDERKDKSYTLGDNLATLLVRPRGWHLVEKHILIDGEPASGSIVDFGLYFFHSAPIAIERGSGPYFYLAKLESHLEARLWNDIFNDAQDALNIPRGTIRATVLIETLLAAFEMEEILYELREHSAGLNAGRWDYIFSVIKKFRNHGDRILPERAQITMTVPFMRAYTELMVATCHKRGAHAIGGMSAFIPNRREPEVTDRALFKVREDKEREARDGCDGTWVAHPDLVPVVMAIFDAALGERPHQKDTLREDVEVSAADLVNTHIEGGTITEAGVHTNVAVALEYLERWLSGTGAVAIHNLMEDAATAEISRAQLWQWLKHGAKLDDGRPFTRALYTEVRNASVDALTHALRPNLGKAAELLDALVLNETFTEFLTLPAYEALD